MITRANRKIVRIYPQGQSVQIMQKHLSDARIRFRVCQQSRRGLRGVFKAILELYKTIFGLAGMAVTS